jgi:hypothetical protein
MSLTDDGSEQLSGTYHAACSYSRSFTNSFPLSGLYCPRAELATRIWSMALEERLVHIRGCPASGKTVLRRILARYIYAPGYQVKTISGWQRDVVMSSGGWEGQLRLITGYTAAQLQGSKGEMLVILFHEAQDGYWDSSLWIDFFKSLEFGNGPIVILFASYGSDSGIPFDPKSLVNTTICASV